MKLLALVLVFVFLVPAGTQRASAQATERDVPFQVIDGGSAEHVRGSIDLVINDQAVWEAMWGLLHKGFSTVPPIPQVDFNERMLIVVGMVYSQLSVATSRWSALPLHAKGLQRSTFGRARRDAVVRQRKQRHHHIGSTRLKDSTSPPFVARSTQRFVRNERSDCKDGG